MPHHLPAYLSRVPVVQGAGAPLGSDHRCLDSQWHSHAQRCLQQALAALDLQEDAPASALTACRFAQGPARKPACECNQRRHSAASAHSLASSAAAGRALQS